MLYGGSFTKFKSLEGVLLIPNLLGGKRKLPISLIWSDLPNFRTKSS